MKFVSHLKPQPHSHTAISGFLISSFFRMHLLQVYRHFFILLIDQFFLVFFTSGLGFKINWILNLSNAYSLLDVEYWIFQMHVLKQVLRLYSFFCWICLHLLVNIKFINYWTTSCTKSHIYYSTWSKLSGERRSCPPSWYSSILWIRPAKLEIQVEDSIVVVIVDPGFG